MTKARNFVLAAAALLTLGTTALSSTEASAYGFRRGGGYHHFGGYRHFGYRHFGYRHFGYRYHWNYRYFGWRNHYNYSYRWPYRYHYNYWRRPAVVGMPMMGPGSGPSAGPAPQMASGPAPSQTQCLAKQYTPEGAVVFIDRCTQESAVTPPPGANPQGPQPQPR